jgi:hypothetical protein
VKRFIEVRVERVAFLSRIEPLIRKSRSLPRRRSASDALIGGSKHAG